MLFQVRDTADNYFATGWDQRRLPQRLWLEEGLLSKLTVKVRCKSEVEKKEKKKILFASPQGCVSGIAILTAPQSFCLKQRPNRVDLSFSGSLGRYWAVWGVVALVWMLPGLFQVSGWGSGLGAGLLICFPAVFAVATKDGARGWWWKVELSTPLEQSLWVRWPYHGLPVAIGGFHWGPCSHAGCSSTGQVKRVAFRQGPIPCLSRGQLLRGVSSVVWKLASVTN